MGDLSAHFSRREFACRGRDCCGESAPVHPALIMGLEQLRALVGKPLRISSGFRCNRHNREISGAADSLHTLGMAADVFVPAGWTAQELAGRAESVPVFHEGGIGIYTSWVHLDVRPTGKARWQG
jgi:uncharacterized protein YcbK (DUF882 family)